MVQHACDPSYMGGIGGRTQYESSLGKNARLYLKNNQSKKGLGCGSSGRAPA
jgi:hypothetical protein